MPTLDPPTHHGAMTRSARPQRAARGRVRPYWPCGCFYGACVGRAERPFSAVTADCTGRDRRGDLMVAFVALGGIRA